MTLARCFKRPNADTWCCFVNSILFDVVFIHTVPLLFLNYVLRLVPESLKIVFCAYSQAFRNLIDKYIFLLLSNILSFRHICFSLDSHEKAHHASVWNRFSCNDLIIDSVKETSYPYFLNPESVKKRKSRPSDESHKRTF